MFSASGLLDLYHEERINQSETLYLTIRADDPKAAYLREDCELRWNGRRFYIFEPVKERDGATAIIRVEAPALWMRLGETKRIGTLTYVGNTVADVLDDVLLSTDWTGDIVSPFDPATPVSLEANDATVLDLVRKVAKIAGAEVYFDTLNKVVQFVTQLGEDRGLAFTYGRNLVSDLRRSNPPAFTRLWPFGKDGLDVSSIAAGGYPFIEDFTYYTAQGLTLPEAQARFTREEVWSDTSFVDAQALYDAAVLRLAAGAQPLVNYEMSVLDLSEQTGIDESDLRIGDTVRASDPDLDFNVSTRVVRLLRRPLDPAGSEVELSYLPVAAPDPSVSDGRGASTEEWVLFKSRSTTPRLVGATRTVLNRLVLDCVTDSQWVVGYSLVGTGVGTGTVTLEAVDTTTSTDILPLATIDIADGEPVNFAFTFGEQDIAAGQYGLVVRATGNSGAGIDIEGLGSTFWVLAKGTTQNALTLPDSIRFDYTGAVQHFTVPDDVSEISIELHGAAGANKNDGIGGKGGKVSASYAVAGGTVLDVYVGGCPHLVGGGASVYTGGFPTGGTAASHYTTVGGGGGGSTDIRPSGAALSATLLIAGGGGGSGGHGGFGPAPAGGHAGFEAGTDGSTWFGDGGTGATASAPGLGGAGTGSTNGEDGDTDGQGQGGDSWDIASSGGGVGSGGGGGGWHGGGGGGNQQAGGGGGSGHIADGLYDLDITDAENSAAHGYAIISWVLPV